MATNLLAPLLILSASLMATPVLAQSADHAAHAQHAQHADHAAHRQAAETKAPAQRWATDAPLREGMRDIREATELLNHYEMGHLDATQRDNAVEQIDAAIKNMVANCKLKPDADAALHGLLGKFMAGADAARKGKFTKAELTPMQQALARYPQLFDDATWSDDDAE